MAYVTAAWFGGPVLRMIRRRISELFPGDARRILEVGVRRGHGLAGYPDRCDVTGTEADPRDLAAARRRIAGAARDQIAGLHRLAPDRLCFPDASFDAVAAVSVMERAGGAVRQIDEMVRVTRPGGRIIVVDRLRKARAPQSARDPLTRALRRLSIRIGRRLARARRLPETLFSRRRDLAPVGTLKIFGFRLHAYERLDTTATPA
ncbi:MAG: methyltransferase domain-containing protein [Pseudomonadota bacterium]